MKFGQILEEFLDAYKVPLSRKRLEVWVNPTQKEISDLRRENKDTFRWAADPVTKKFYIFDPKHVHMQLFKALGIKYLGSKAFNFLTGIFEKGKVKEQKIDLGKKLDFVKEARMKKLKMNWDWTYEYLPGIKDLIKEGRRIK